jgi:hypothetical protein
VNIFGNLFNRGCGSAQPLVRPPQYGAHRHQVAS